jgi:hypothetical protein
MRLRDWLTMLHHSISAFNVPHELAPRTRDARRRAARFAAPCAVAVLLLTAACASPPAETLRDAASLEDAAARVGRIVDVSETPDARHVVFIKDQHATTSSFMRLRPQLRAVQRANRLMVDYLLNRGYTLLGCEYRFGEILESEATRAQYKLVRARLQPPALLDEYSVYQPIRFRVLWGDRLAVWGVEDPELYGAAVALLDSYLKARQAVKRHDIESPQRADAERRMVELLAALDRQTIARGVKAADNLLTLMDRLQRRQAILLIGGAHVAAASELLRMRGVSFTVFEPTGYGRQGIDDDPEPESRD